MTTKAEQIMAAVFTKLNTPTAVVVGATYRSRMRAIEQSKPRAVNLRRRADTRGEASNIGRHFRQLAISVEVYAKGALPDSGADSTMETIVTRLMADRTLGGLCDDIKIGDVVPDWVDNESDMVVMDMEFLIDYESLDSVL